MCCGFGHQARALLMEVLCAVASGIKLGRCWLLMEVLCAVASGIKLGRCWLVLSVLLSPSFVGMCYCSPSFTHLSPIFWGVL
jgi:hypothetical protein